ncbi:MAG: pantetheine-phosphate adenylyltransferase [bacterium]|nr:pantetheine-phosphate adenylyltransferase [bacterium]
MMKAVYPGSFDPPTNGHIDIIKKASRIFDVVIVAVTENRSKVHMFSINERLKMLKDAIKLKNVEVKSFKGLLVDFLKKVEADVVIRGLRAVSDFDYEFQLALMNRHISGGKIETVFMIPDEKNIFLSSSLVKEIACLGMDVSEFVPENISMALKKKFLK